MKKSFPILIVSCACAFVSYSIYKTLQTRYTQYSRPAVADDPEIRALLVKAAKAVDAYKKESGVYPEKIEYTAFAPTAAKLKPVEVVYFRKARAPGYGIRIARDHLVMSINDKGVIKTNFSVIRHRHFPAMLERPEFPQ